MVVFVLEMEETRSVCTRDESVCTYGNNTETPRTGVYEEKAWSANVMRILYIVLQYF